MPAVTSLLSAVLYVLAFPPYAVSPLAFVALVPWLVLLLSGQSKRPKLQSWWLCIGVSLLGFHWVAYVLKQFAGLPWPLAALGLLGFSTFGQLQFVGFALAAPWLVKGLTKSAGRFSLRSCGWLLLGATSYTALDYLLPKLFRDTLGHSWTGFSDLKMNARWAGAYGLTLISVYCNLAIAWAIVLIRNRGEPSTLSAIKRGLPGIVTAIGLLGLVQVLGGTLRQKIEKTISQPTAQIPLGVIQANIGDLEKLASETGVRSARKQVMQTYYSLSDEVLQKNPEIQAVIWPETAYPSTFRSPEFSDDLELDQQVENYSKSRKVALFFGGYDRDIQLRQDYNALFFLGPGAQSFQTYRKNRLLLFGEEMPFSGVFPQLRKWFPQVGNFGRGSGPSALEVPTTPPTRTAPAICYEVLFSEDMILAKKAGAQWILNITNDSWFGPRAEPELHLALSTFRSIELGIPMVRSTNTGITAWVDPTGKVHQASKTFEKTVVSILLPIVPLEPSWVERFNDPMGKLCVAATLLIWLWGRFQNWRQQKEQLSKL
ncbi:MAG: apolipoprotein N-acyltransferase [Oligoflexia bacterium]